ncbi:MAG: tyrosine-type recombinase/integrase, partial [Nitrospirota bacterium]
PRQHVKAKKATVMIPLTTRAAAIIARQVRHGDAPCVFTHAGGRAYSPEQVSMAVLRAVKEAQLSDVSLHTLRHTFISRLVQAGRPLPEGGGLSRASRDHDDHALRASGAESFACGDSGLGAARPRSTDGTPVIHSHAGVTLLFGKRVSAGVPNGIGWLLQCQYRLENSLSWNNQSSMTGGDLQFTNFT